jgi:tRNA A-37 threonylcarbamoyl transferase component Bud32
MTYIKRFGETAAKEVEREADMLKTSADLGLSPAVIDTDNRTYIEMEDLEEMCIADKYGEDIDDVPEEVQEDIYSILLTLYKVAGIEYRDVTPYNFIEKDGVTYVIDFGHARYVDEDELTDEYLIDVLCSGALMWNPEFR